MHPLYKNYGEQQFCQTLKNVILQLTLRWRENKIAKCRVYVLLLCIIFTHPWATWQYCCSNIQVRGICDKKMCYYFTASDIKQLVWRLSPFTILRIYTRRPNTYLLYLSVYILRDNRISVGDKTRWLMG